MLKCTAVIPRDGYNEERKLNVPVLPNVGDTVTYLYVHNESFTVRSIEYVNHPDSGDCLSINVYLEPKDA